MNSMDSDHQSAEQAQDIVVRRVESRALTHEQFHQLNEVPAAAVWLANIDNENTRRAYRSDVEAFIAFCGVEHADDLRQCHRLAGAPRVWAARSGDGAPQALGGELAL